MDEYRLIFYWFDEQMFVRTFLTQDDLEDYYMSGEYSMFSSQRLFNRIVTQKIITVSEKEFKW